ncbi:MAG: GNAT family N-acetyltransferase [Flavobacteriaceae bacterium]|nr:GNAT family N-acetyltransferase [Flavobacteriaceae bacterium]
MEIVVANRSHIKFAGIICDTIAVSAQDRGTGIARRTPEYIIQKIELGNGVIALEGDNFAGFCYIETWDDKEFVVNSGLIVHPDFRKRGLAKKIKKKILDYSISKYPDAKIFGITTGLAVLKINYELGYQPVTFSELTTDKAFWDGCKTCVNFDVLKRTEQEMCLCTGMLYDPIQEKRSLGQPVNLKVLKRLKKIKQALFLKKRKKTD